MHENRIHLIGIGGIGISALARHLVHTGHTVSGTNDCESSETLDGLRAAGVPISLKIDAQAVPEDVELFVYSDAWLSTAPEFLEEIRARGVPMLSYFEALGRITRGMRVVLVTGTHGKTTTTAMLAKVFTDGGCAPTVFAGSIMTEYQSNYVPGTSNLYVVEGCEYRRHFLQFEPHVLVINNIELDHTDYYTDLKDVQSAFRALVGRVQTGGVVVTNTDDSAISSVLEGSEVSVVPYQDKTIPTLKVPGAFNQMNARAAKTAALACVPTVDSCTVDRALASFTGTWRRFEYKGVTSKGAIVYDDYAHHPSAMQKTFNMVREEFPNKRFVAVFHPHLYSRTKQFFDPFAWALTIPDEVIVLPVYAARESPDPMVSSERLVMAVSERGGKAHYAPTFAAACEQLVAYGNDTIILTVGAGDVFTVAQMMVA